MVRVESEVMGMDCPWAVRGQVSSARCHMLLPTFVINEQCQAIIGGMNQGLQLLREMGERVFTLPLEGWLCALSVVSVSHSEQINLHYSVGATAGAYVCSCYQLFRWLASYNI